MKPNPKSEVRSPKSETRLRVCPGAGVIAAAAGRIRATRFSSGFTSSASIAPASGLQFSDFGLRTSDLCAAVLALLLWLAVPGLVFGQGIPAAINYQGTLTDNAGNPSTNGYYEIQFRIWDDPKQAGSADYIWGRAFPLHVVTNGMFNVLLSDDGGLVTNSGAPQALSILQAFAGPDRYLGLTVTRNPAGQITSPVEISPRQRLVSAPYAMQAQNATAATFATNAAIALNLLGTTNNGGNLGILGANVIEFGRGTPGKQQDAGKIGYETWSSDSLDIVGAGTNGGNNRKIKLWAESGVTANGTVTAPAFSGNGTIPVGGIIMWSGAIANIPSGWALCNGQTVSNRTTPNLQDRFIVGAGNSYAVTATGGSTNVTLSVPNLPAHTHTYTDFYFNEVDDTWKGGGDASPDRWTGNGPFATRTSDPTGSGTAFDIRPPYYALAYIMRVQ